MDMKKTELSQNTTKIYTDLETADHAALFDDDTNIFDIGETIEESSEFEAAGMELSEDVPLSMDELLKDDFGSSDSHDLQQETDLLADEITRDEELYAGNSGLSDELTFEELVDTGLQSDALSTLFSDNSAEPDRNEYELDGNALQTEELLVDEEPGTDTAESLGQLTFEELIDTDLKSDSFSTQLSNDYALPDGNDFDPDGFFSDEITEDGEQDFDVTELPGELSFEELIATDSEAETQNTENYVYSDNENESDQPEQEYLPIEKSAQNQHTLVTGTVVDKSKEKKSGPARNVEENEGVCDDAKYPVLPQSMENQLDEKALDEAPACTEIKKTNKSTASNIRVSVAKKTQQMDNWLPKSLTVLALIIVFGAIGFWYGYNRVDNGSQLGQPDLATTTQNAVYSVQAPLSELKEQLDAQAGENSREFLMFSKATKQLEKRLASVEEKLVDYGSKDQVVQVVELEQQLKFLERLVHESILENQDMAVEITLQLNQLDTSINQLETRVSRKELPQNSRPKSVDPSENGVPLTAITVAPVQRSVIIKEVQDKIEFAESIAETTVTPPEMEVAPEKMNWSVNLASFKDRTSAEKEQNHFNGIGLETTIRKAHVLGTTRYRVRIEGFPSTQTAREFIQVQLDRNKIKSAWVSSTYF